MSIPTAFLVLLVTIFVVLAVLIVVLIISVIRLTMQIGTVADSTERAIIKVRRTVKMITQVAFSVRFVQQYLTRFKYLRQKRGQNHGKK